MINNFVVNNSVEAPYGSSDHEIVAFAVIHYLKKFEG